MRKATKINIFNFRGSYSEEALEHLRLSAQVCVWCGLRYLL